MQLRGAPSSCARQRLRVIGLEEHLGQQAQGWGECWAQPGAAAGSKDVPRAPVQHGWVQGSQRYSGGTQGILRGYSRVQAAEGGSCTAR